ncbi:hypothetical protein L873DRAFT_1842398 [Choiromyces venosus 120613-1]|uniref:Uncharacterized protein n=1 Tax=Choiromyces venosus 120613-1 TaxID=1336337 RepID=A0A3N4JWM0_9PEZI|nr:hypothetical protein L873DRAFT_1842398 [Choiromyces venosus 120613-1]
MYRKIFHACGKVDKRSSQSLHTCSASTAGTSMMAQNTILVEKLKEFLGHFDLTILVWVLCDRADFDTRKTMWCERGIEKGLAVNCRAPQSPAVTGPAGPSQVLVWTDAKIPVRPGHPPCTAVRPVRARRCTDWTLEFTGLFYNLSRLMFPDAAMTRILVLETNWLQVIVLTTLNAVSVELGKHSISSNNLWILVPQTPYYINFGISRKKRKKNLSDFGEIHHTRNHGGVIQHPLTANFFMGLRNQDDVANTGNFSQSHYPVIPITAKVTVSGLHYSLS